MRAGCSYGRKLLTDLGHHEKVLYYHSNSLSPSQRASFGVKSNLRVPVTGVPLNSQAIFMVAWSGGSKVLAMVTSSCCTTQRDRPELC